LPCSNISCSVGVFRSVSNIAQNPIRARQTNASAPSGTVTPIAAAT